MATTDSPLFPRDLGKEIAAWLGPLPTSPETFRAGPGGTSSILGCVSTSYIHPPQTCKAKESSFPVIVWWPVSYLK